MIWVEIRCDKRLPSKLVGNHYEVCCSDINETPMGKAANTLTSVGTLMRILGVEATYKGWKKIGGDWICPTCVKHMNEK